MSLHVDQMAMSSYIAATKRHTDVMEQHTRQVREHAGALDAHRLTLARTCDLIEKFIEVISDFDVKTLEYYARGE